ncbi:TIMELESS-interacting protein [Aphelenchoides besseyi]|nr:TIMELESS-interacting protein [Aphelenchoides besseyi]
MEVDFDDFDQIYADQAIEVNDENDEDTGKNVEYDKFVGDLAARQEKNARERKRELKPRFKYTQRELIGPKGLVALRKSFEDFELPTDGKSPYTDLFDVMQRMELWAHRLCPSMTFDDFLIKTEQLGRKRPTKTYMTKLRMGMPLEDGDFEDKNEDDENADETEKNQKEPPKKKSKKSTKEYVPIHVC